MAITLLGKPDDNNNPAYNPLVYYFDSTNKAQQGFRYIARVLTPSNQLIFEKTILPDINTGKCILNINRELSDFVSYDLNLSTSNIAGFNAADSYYRYKLDIGEEYLITWDFFDFEYIGSPNLPAYNPKNLPNATAISTTSNANIPPYSPGDKIVVSFTSTSPVKPQLQGVQEVLAVVPRPTGGWRVILNIGWVGSGPADPGSTRYADNKKTRITGLYTAINNECVFNGVFSPENFLTYDMDNYLMTGSTGTKKWLSQIYSGYTVRRNNFLWLNWMTNDQTTLVPTILEFTSDDGTVYRSGVVISTSSWIKQINVGPNRDSFGALAAGSGPLLKPTTKWYTVKLINSSNAAVSETIKLNIDDKCPHGEVIDMLFLDKLGSMLTWNFTLRNVENQSVNRLEYTKYLGELSGGKYKYNLTDGGSEIYSSEFTRSFVLRTDYMDTASSKFFVNLIHSPVSLIRIDGQFHRCNITTNSVEVKKEKWHELKRYEVMVTLSNNNKINI